MFFERFFALPCGIFLKQNATCGISLQQNSPSRSFHLRFFPVFLVRFSVFIRRISLVFSDFPILSSLQLMFSCLVSYLSSQNFPFFTFSPVLFFHLNNFYPAIKSSLRISPFFLRFPFIANFPVFPCIFLSLRVFPFFLAFSFLYVFSRPFPAKLPGIFPSFPVFSGFLIFPPWLSPFFPIRFSVRHAKK